MPPPGDPENRWFSIYVHTCVLNGKQYVGQAVHCLLDIQRGFSNIAERAVRRRWKQKCRENTLLGRTVRELGADNFRHEIVEQVFGQTATNLAEEKWITSLGTLEPAGYNRKTGGQRAFSAEELSNLCKRGRASMSIEQRKQAARKAQETLGQEGLHLRAVRRAETMGPEKLSAAIRKGHETRGEEGRRLAQQRRIAAIGRDGFVAAVKKMNETLGPEGRRARSLSVAKSLGAAGLSEKAVKGHYTKRLGYLRQALAARDRFEIRRLLTLGLSLTIRLGVFESSVPTRH